MALMANYLAYSYYIVVEWYTWYVDLGHTSGVAKLGTLGHVP